MSRRFLARRIHMALQAGVVVGGGLRLELLVRIMTGDTGDPGVAFLAPALAGNKPVWRGSGRRLPLLLKVSHPTRCRGRLRKNRRSRRAQRCGVEDGWLPSREPGCGLPLSLTGHGLHLARDRLRMSRREPDGLRRNGPPMLEAGCMTTETPHHFRLGGTGRSIASSMLEGESSAREGVKSIVPRVSK